MLELPNVVTCLDPNPRDPLLYAMGSISKFVRVYNVKEDKIVDWYQSQDQVTALSYSPDGRLLVVGFAFGVCRVYTAGQYLEFQCEISCRNSNVKKSDSQRVVNIRFVGDNEFIVSTGDSNIRLFNCQDLSKHVMKFKGHQSSSGLLRADCNE